MLISGSDLVGLHHQAYRQIGSKVLASGVITSRDDNVPVHISHEFHDLVSSGGRTIFIVLGAYPTLSH